MLVGKTLTDGVSAFSKHCIIHYTPIRLGKVWPAAGAQKSQLYAGGASGRAAQARCWMLEQLQKKMLENLLPLVSLIIKRNELLSQS